MNNKYIEILKENNIDLDTYNYLVKYLPKSKKLDDAINELLKGIPVQYIVGNVYFYNSIINVDKRVLIPRFETELLVEKTINKIHKKFNNKINILDLCTGSGCIAISLFKELECNVDASDISLDALTLAQDNANINKANINFINSDIFSNINKKYDVIISNPPYLDIKEDVMDIVKNNEPTIALYAENNGLIFYENILKDIANYLNDEFIVAFEIGLNQSQPIIEYINKYLNNVIITVEKDYSNRERYIFIKNNN